MPIYEYKCGKCGDKKEVLQKMSDDPLTICESCGGELKKLITNTSFVLKGSGWYVTDYPSAERKKAIESKNKPLPGKDKKPETKPETKADTKKKAVNE